jgi:CRISPR type I-E-associated protein CasB/Cse2
MKNHDKAECFIAYLENNYKDDRGARVALRGALSESLRSRAWPYLGNFTDERDLRFFEVASAVWASSTEAAVSGNGLNIGRAIRELGDLGSEKSAERRLVRLLACDRCDVADHIAPIVKLLRSKGVEPDCKVLLSDLLYWGESVRIRWAQGFWAGSKAEKEQ